MHVAGDPNRLDDGLPEPSRVCGGSWLTGDLQAPR